jgi:hypothetical protein
MYYVNDRAACIYVGPGASGTAWAGRANSLRCLRPSWCDARGALLGVKSQAVVR